MKLLFVCTYLYFDVCTFCFSCSFYIPGVSHFSTKGAKSLCAEFNLNNLYLIEIMQTFFLQNKKAGH